MSDHERGSEIWRRVRILETALEEIAHLTVDAHELSHLDVFRQEDILTAREALRQVRA